MAQTNRRPRSGDSVPAAKKIASLSANAPKILPPRPAHRFRKRKRSTRITRRRRSALKVRRRHNVWKKRPNATRTRSEKPSLPRHHRLPGPTLLSRIRRLLKRHATSSRHFPRRRRRPSLKLATLRRRWPPRNRHPHLQALPHLLLRSPRASSQRSRRRAAPYPPTTPGAAPAKLRATPSPRQHRTPRRWKKEPPAR